MENIEKSKIEKDLEQLKKASDRSNEHGLYEDTKQVERKEAELGSAFSRGDIEDVATKKEDEVEVVEEKPTEKKDSKAGLGKAFQ